MKNTLSFKKNIAILLLFFVCKVVANPPANLNGWDLVFSDEFDGNSLDNSKWNPTYNWGHTHNHQAYCVKENVFVENGLLRIKGEAKRHPEAPATCSNGGNTYSLDYTSGAIDTRGKFEVKYGYIEGRFKMPKQLGTWPAFWTLQDGWPPEIDIFEVPHARTDHHYYLHYTNTDWYASHGSAWDHEASFGGVHTGPDKSADFHNYGLAWSETTLSFYFDDKLVASYNRSAEVSQLSAQYIIINLAIGGWATSGGNPIEVTNGNPAYLECDWVRVWQSKGSANNNEKVRLYSLETHQCMVASGNDIILGDCDDEAAQATITDLGTGTYRINFGEKVLEIPNEATKAGDAVGLWGWNGKAHQQLYIANEESKGDNVVSLKFSHSDLYVQTYKNDVIQQSKSSGDAIYWKLLKEGESPTSIQKISNNALRASLFSYSHNILSVQPSNQFTINEDLIVSIYNVEGKVISRHSLKNIHTIELNIELKKGIYFITIQGKEYFESSKIAIE